MWFLLTAIATTFALGTSQYDYGDVLGKSILFFEAQRSGWLPDNNRVPWRGDSATNDGWEDAGIDLTGGWYDAGDHVKFGFPMASTATLLAWSIVDFRTGYSTAGELNNGLDCIRWATDYFLRCHSGTNQLYGQLGDGYLDHAFWGRPEDMTMWRPSMQLNEWAPGSDIAGETAAALAAASMAFRETDGGYADILLDNARQLFDFAYNHRGIYSDQIPAGDFYGSTDYNDELCFAAAWLFRATGDNIYLQRVQEFYSGDVQWSLSWDAKMAGVQMLMYIITSEEGYANDVRGFLDSWRPGGGIHYTPGGLAWRDMWGPNRYSANTAFISILARKHNVINDDWAKEQIDYMLGSNPRGSSYVCGFGNNPPLRPHHRAGSCPNNFWDPCNWDNYNSPDPNPNVLIGALVGGPDEWDHYEDRRDDYIANEVACDYNSGFQGALAGIVEVYESSQPPATSPPGTAPPGSGPSSGPTSTSPPNVDNDYTEALGKSILFFEAQRSGPLPGNNRIPWRGDSAMEDGDDNVLDLKGGWYDAGDHVKFNFPMASTTTLLAWSIVDFRNGYAAAGELDNALDSIKWATDYFLKCDAATNQLYAQVGDGYADHAFWGRPEHMDMFRPSMRLEVGVPGADLAGETAAAMAAASMAFRDTDAGYADTLINSAIRVYEFGYNNRGIYSQSLDGVTDFYGSTGYEDELCYGAAWIYRATGDSTYLQRAQEFYSDDLAWSLSWDSKLVGCQMMMYILTTDSSYGSAVTNFLDSWRPGGDITYTPGGLAWRDQWGPLRYAANTAFVSVLARKYGLISDDWAKGQVDYMLGQNPRESSYVCGMGNNPPLRPHHRSASCSPDINAWCDWTDYNKPDPNPNVLTGALVGGPDEWDNYNDSRDDYIANEVACDYNSGFQGALAGLVEQYYVK